jgi:polyisoprenoid-binding protein YceI
MKNSIFKVVLKLLFLIIPLVSFKPKSDNNIKIVADKRTSKVTYNMRHPMHSWEGVCKDVNAVLLLNGSTRMIEQVAVAIRVDAFNSGNPNRDSHALEVLEALKYPKVTFSGSNIKVSKEILTVEGNLTFHGISKPITIVATREDFVNKLVIDGKFDVSLTDFKVERPSLIGMKTDDIINLKFQLIFNL